MRLVDERSGLELIPADECLRLLERGHVGRVGLTQSGRPVILPVNYVLDGDTVVFRTDEGTKLRFAQRRSFVAFEVDDIDAIYHTGWDVLVTGVAEEVHDPGEIERIDKLGLRPWAEGPKRHYVRIRPGAITGRRVGGQSR